MIQPAQRLTKQQLIRQTWKSAKIHSQASKVGMPTNLQNSGICTCCDQPIEKIPISLTQHTKQFQVFGFGYSLYFSFLKYCIFLVLVLIASKTADQLYQATKQNYKFCFEKKIQNKNAAEHKYFVLPKHNQIESMSMQHNKHFRNLNFHNVQAFKIKSNLERQISHRSQSKQKPFQKQTKRQGGQIKSSDHHNEQCTSFMIYFSLFRESLYRQETFIKVVFFLVQLVALITIRNMILKQQQYFDERTTSLSDYSIIISNLPNVAGNRQRLQRLFYQHFDMTYGFSNSHIKEIIFIFKDQILQQISKKKKKLETEILQKINHQNYIHAEGLKKRLQDTIIEEKQRALIVHQLIAKDMVPCTKIIVVFNSQSDKAQIIRNYRLRDQNIFDPNQYFRDVISSSQNKYKIRIKQAPQPNQIIWEHIDESDDARSLLVFKGYSLTFALLAITTVVFYFILLSKTKLFISALQMKQHDPESKKAEHFKTFATIIVFLAMFGVVLFNKFVMGKVLHKIVHKERHAFVDRQSHSFAIKYSLGMFFTTAIMTLAVQAITFRNFYSHHYGVIEEETIMFFVTAFLIPLIWFIHPYNLFRRLQFRRNKSKLVSQQKANLLSEDVQYDLGKRYAQIFQIMWFTFLYSQLIPLGSFLIVIGLTLYFWIDKYNFLRCSTLKSGMSGKMAILALKSLDATLFLPFLGQLIFDAILRSKLQIVTLILTICGIAYLFVPVSEIIWYFNSEKFFLQQKLYDQMQYTFKETYITLHPVYKLAFADKIQKYKQKYRQNLIESFKTVRLYGMGRGTYKQDPYTSENKQSRLESVHLHDDNLKSTFFASS